MPSRIEAARNALSQGALCRALEVNGMNHLARWITGCALVAGVFVASPGAQPVFRGAEIFPPEEFAARRAKVMDRIGDAVAIVLGTPGPPGEMPFRQNSQFFYLTGVTEPRARVIIDGRTKKTVVYLQPRNERRDASMFGPSLAPGLEAAATLGVDEARPDADFTMAISGLAADHRTFYTPFAAEVLGSQSQGDPTRFWNTNREDRWDGRDSREAAFMEKLKAAAPQSEIKNLDPILNALRAIKTPREIAVIREATRIAGEGIMAAMRDAKPGMREYELQADAEFVFKKYGALGAAYFALIATGQNTYYTHYNRNTAVLQDGDLVQFDYAPDYKYYQSDVTRVFPANGKFTPRQREFYGIYLKLYQTLMSSIQAHERPIDAIRTAVRKMDAIMASYPFTDDHIKAAAVKFVEDLRSRNEANSLGHNVGLEVHDPGGLQAPTFEPGRIFTIEPQMRIEEEHLGLRLEDMILITDGGYEDLSQVVPIEINDIEKIMREPGLSDAVRADRGAASMRDR
jgi:Xaa-Pro aminopeptidase